MNAKDIDLIIIEISYLMQMMISIEKTLENVKDIKYKNDLNKEFELRLEQLREKCKNAVQVLDDWFKYEKENNLPINLNYRLVQTQFKSFV